LILVQDLEWVSLLGGKIMKRLRGMLRLVGYRMFFGTRLLPWDTSAPLLPRRLTSNALEEQSIFFLAWR